ncbi:MAG: cyclic nucleotide-binding domain-containing protein [Anaerolineae bacterium]
MSALSLLKRVQLFANLKEDELAQLAAICTRKETAAGELIIRQNTTGSEMYIIADGSVEVFIEGVAAARSLVLLGEGQVIGEMALIDQGYRSASVRATSTGAVLYIIDKADFIKLVNENYYIGFIVMRNLAIDIAFKLRHRNLAEL